MQSGARLARLRSLTRNKKRSRVPRWCLGVSCKILIFACLPVLVFTRKTKRAVEVREIYGENVDRRSQRKPRPLCPGHVDTARFSDLKESALDAQYNTPPALKLTDIERIVILHLRIFVWSIVSILPSHYTRLSRIVQRRRGNKKNEAFLQKLNCFKKVFLTIICRDNNHQIFVGSHCGESPKIQS